MRFTLPTILVMGGSAALLAALLPGRALAFARDGVRSGREDGIGFIDVTAQRLGSAYAGASPGASPGYVLPPAAAPYADAIRAAERSQGLPDGLLGRLLWKESRFDPNAFNAGSGAQGIAQIIPRWHPGVNPYDPFDAIPYAAGYLRENFDRFGSWDKALAAYNWGPTNLARAVASRGDNWASALPAETKDYVTDITGAVSTVPTVRLV